ncbi:hypothetical protein PHLCEN_2v12674 [Hermanssonia centrifuga]|uniref:Uncharacterized protein n=1 Tax=Hermanssonia centrifuga TaxID=98765 RepID=A0A2R6NG93_9APHY|nr:hypothetical protein PHLCEN_2v12674 [Hermanssonia centrifuga]
MDFSQFAQMDGSNMLDSFSAGHSTSAEGALIPFNPINDRKTELLLMGWPMHLPEPEVTRHL